MHLEHIPHGLAGAMGVCSLRLHVCQVHNSPVVSHERCGERQQGIFHPKALGAGLLEDKQHPFMGGHLCAKHQASAALIGCLRNLSVNLVHAGLQLEARQICLRTLLRNCTQVDKGQENQCDTSFHPPIIRPELVANAHAYGAVAQLASLESKGVFTIRSALHVYQHIQVPAQGQKITVNSDKSLNVPDHPIIPFIEGDGVGQDVTPVMRKVVDAAVARAYAGRRQIHWMEVFAGEKSTRIYGSDVWLPLETTQVLREFVVSIKGPLNTPVGGGIRSLNVALRQALDLFVCLRPVQYFKGVPSPLKEPEKTNMVIFRENSEDIYAGIEYAAESPEAKKLIDFLNHEMGASTIRFPNTSAIGIKPVSIEGTQRFIRKAIQYAIDHDKPSVTIVHKGNIMKYTEGGFRDWALALAQKEFGAKLIDGGPWCRITHPKTGKSIIIKDVIADAFLQQILMRPAEYSVVATLNLNGDYISDAIAAQVGGIGIAPGANLSDTVACFEATHGTAPKYAGKDYVNPGSMILSAEMMLRHMGWTEAADLIIQAMESSIAAKRVTYDFARLMDGATQVSCSGFGQIMMDHI